MWGGNKVREGLAGLKENANNWSNTTYLHRGDSSWLGESAGELGTLLDGCMVQTCAGDSQCPCRPTACELRNETQQLIWSLVRPLFEKREAGPKGGQAPRGASAGGGEKLLSSCKKEFRGAQGAAGQEKARYRDLVWGRVPLRKQL